MNDSVSKAGKEVLDKKLVTKDFNKYILVLLFKWLIGCLTALFLLGLVVIIGHFIQPLDGIISIVILIVVPVIITIIFWCLLVRIPYIQLPTTKETIYIIDGKLFFCAQTRNRYHVVDNYYYIHKIMSVKKYPFVWTITCNSSHCCYDGNISKSKFTKPKGILKHLKSLQSINHTIKIGRLYNKKNEKILENMFNRL